ncbi:hypothetical protein TNCT_227691 [Trichonephila clavata]|uniref:Uncharacterized protein n=1 Tax=Trichonephila clavata TaxID=2740835 RepID=A0A8X6J1I7_TRICU|nr:hypothetical protein TNCT_227691 [Trichonephila clavata]
MCPKKEISNSQAEKSGKNKSFNSDVDNHARREKIFLQSQEKKSSSDAKDKKIFEFRKQHDEPAVEPSFIENVSEERNISNSHAGKSGKNKSFNSDVDNHARREKIFLQSQERKNPSSDAKKDKMKHSGNPVGMNTE